jgi:chemotaxis protein methyltransferase CheR
MNMQGSREEHFEFIRRMVREESGIVLEPERIYLMESRLRPLMSRAGLVYLHELVRRLKDADGDDWRRAVVEAMATNETSFFRDADLFDMLRRVVIPKLREVRGQFRRLRIWSGACAGGQEPYSMAIYLYEHFPELAEWDLRILASDISTRDLEYAGEGRYTDAELDRGMPLHLRLRHFEPCDGGGLISREIRRRVEFSHVNLTDEWPVMPRMDLILLRNVLIYFDAGTRRAILHRTQELLHPQGFLVLGNGESALTDVKTFRRVAFGSTACFTMKES